MIYISTHNSKPTELINNNLPSNKVFLEFCLQDNAFTGFPTR